MQEELENAQLLYNDFAFRGQSFRSKNSEAVAVSDEDFSTLLHRR
jgi:hypothetical protein